MDLVALQIFKTVVEEGGINSGAKRLHRVPSNVTMRIKQLEASLGASLFVREKRRLALSPAGELFLGYAEQLLEISERARHAVQDDAPRGVLRIGALESIVASRLPPLLSAYHRKFPGVRVELTTGTNDVLVDGVLNRRLDAAFVVEADAAAGLQSMATFKEELVLIAPRSHPAIGHPRDVATDTVLSFGAGCAYRRRLLRWFASAGRVPERVLELGSYPAMVACAASGTGVALIPKSVLDTLSGVQNISIHRLKKDKDRKVTTCLIWRSGECPAAVTALKTQVGAQNKKGRAPVIAHGRATRTTHRLHTR